MELGNEVFHGKQKCYFRQQCFSAFCCKILLVRAVVTLFLHRILKGSINFPPSSTSPSLCSIPLLTSH